VRKDGGAIFGNMFVEQDARFGLLPLTRAVNPGYLLSRLSSIMAGVAAWLDAPGGLDTHAPRELNAFAPHPSA
jgi:hypothetical protein